MKNKRLIYTFPFPTLFSVSNRTWNCVSILWVFVFILLFTNTSANDSLYFEKIYLQTDREYYFSGETAYFKAYLLNEGEEIVKSKILYVELVDLYDHIVQKNIYKINNTSVSGTITVPDSLLTGTYLLRAYTNWHRNFNNRYAFYKELIVVNQHLNSYKSVSIDKDSTIQTNNSPFTVIPCKDSILVSIPFSNSVKSGNISLNIFTKKTQVYSQPIHLSGDTTKLLLSRTAIPQEALKFELKSNDKIIACSFLNNTTSVNLELKTDKTEYKPREKVRVNIKLNDSVKLPKSSTLSASVWLKPQTNLEEIKNINTISDWINFNCIIPPEFQNPKKSNEYSGREGTANWFYEEKAINNLRYPIESQGRILSGTVINKATQQPQSNVLVFCSYKDTISYLEYDITDENGKYYLALPGNQNIKETYLQVWEAPINIALCEIVPDETNTSIPFLQKQELIKNDAKYLRSIFSQELKYHEINKVFSKRVSTVFSVSDSTIKPSIYNGQNESVFPADFLKLNSFEEIVLEILSGVRLKKDSTGISLRMLDKKNGKFVLQNPLVLINGLPVNSYNFLTGLNSDDIEKIDLVYNYFVVGAKIFQGVISIKLKHKLNLADLSGNSFYPMKTEINRKTSLFEAPEYITLKSKNSRTPDFRNTLAWLPEIQLSGDSAQITFFTSDISGTYQIYVEGLINKDIPVEGTKFITVTER